MIHIHTTQHGYPGRQVIRATKFLRSIEDFLHNYLIRVTPLEPRIWRWLLHSWKICGSLPHCVLRARVVCKLQQTTYGMQDLRERRAT